jgi:hypothetical protein
VGARRQRAEGKLVGVQLPENHGAGRSQPGDRGGVTGRDVLTEDLRTGRRPGAGHVDDVLDRDRHPLERPRRSRVRFGERLVGPDGDVGVQLGVGLDPVEVVLHRLAWRQLARLQPRF